MKTNSIIQTSRQDNRIVFQVRGVAEPIVFDPDKVSAVNRARAMVHGFTQRISDGGALSRNPETGLPATPQDKADKMRRIAEHLMEGGDVWEMKRAASEGGAGTDAGLTLRAMVRAGLGKGDEGTPLERAESLIAATQTKKGLDRKAALALWAKTDKVREAIAQIKAESSTQAVGADDLLDEMLEDEAGE